MSTTEAGPWSMKLSSPSPIKEVLRLKVRRYNYLLDGVAEEQFEAGLVGLLALIFVNSFEEKGLGHG
jgi:hypothetical protein